MENYFPKMWDLRRIDECCAHMPGEIFQKQPFWHKDFQPVSCENIDTFAMMMGHEIALYIKKTKEEGKKLALILPVGPMGMYKWVVYFVQKWNIDLQHVYGFNMDEWSDSEGNTLQPSNQGSFEYAMMNAFYGPLGKYSIPDAQRNFATKANLPKYEEKIMKIKDEGGYLATVFGIGRVFHIAFWEPQFSEEFDSEEEWKKQTHRIGAKLHPLTIEQNALHSFKSRTTLVPAFANTIGPGLFLQSDWIIGGSDGLYERDMMWSGMSLWVTLRHGPTTCIPSSYMPTMPGRLFFLSGLAGPLTPDCN